ncbi:MAG: glycosyltransferase family 4 protein [Candidatus Pacearchaeota archaeon]
MRILIIPWNLYPENAGGAGKSIYYTAKGLAKLPKVSAVHILTSTTGKTRTEKQGKLFIERYNDLDIKFRTGKEPFGFNDIKRKLDHFKIYGRWEKRIVEKYSKFKPDIVHCNDPFSLRRVKESLRNTSIPVVVSVRGYWPSSTTGTMMDKKKGLVEKWTFANTLRSERLKTPLSILKHRHNKRNLKDSEGIHFISDYVKNKTEEHVVLNSVRNVIFNPRPFLEKTSSKKRDSKTVAYVGELTYKKGLHKLLEALRILNNQGKKYKLLVAGVGPKEKEFKKFVKENDLDKNVIFLGWVDEPNMIYQKSVITVVPSLWPDPLPGVAFEPMFNDSIPIVSRYGGMPEIVPLKELVVNVENPKILADKIEEIMENPEKQKEIRKTFKPWLKKFSVETAAKQFYSFYEDVIGDFKGRNKK